MSLNVLVIPEDFRKDQYLLKPIIEAMLQALGKPHVNVRVCQDPRLGGISAALDWRCIEPVVDRYRGVFGLLILVVDRDGDAGRQSRLAYLEAKVSASFGSIGFLTEHAWQEVEVWALAGADDLPADWEWRCIRAEVHAKELYFTPYARRRRLDHLMDEGRALLGQQAARSYSRLRTLCPEDIGRLEGRTKDWLARQDTP